MAERCPDCGRLLGEGSSSDGFCWRRGDRKCRVLLVSNLRAKLTKLEALVAVYTELERAADGVVFISRRKHVYWDAYDAAKAELEKVRGENKSSRFDAGS